MSDHRVIESRTCKVKAFDTAIDFTLTAELDGTTLDLTGASVKFLIKSTADGAVVVEDTATVTDATVITFPNTYMNRVTVVDDLNGE